MSKIPANIIKEYPQRGPLNQYRVDTSFVFHCYRCGQEKKSKLVAIYDNDLSQKIFNGCYGYLLSIFTIKRNAKEVDEKVDELSNLLFQAIIKDKINQQLKLYELKENRAKYLTENSKLFISTSKYLAQSLKNNLNLD